MLEILKSLFGGLILFSSMYVGSKCWNYFLLSGENGKNSLKFFGWLVLYIIALNILNSF